MLSRLGGGDANPTEQEAAARLKESVYILLDQVPPPSPRPLHSKGGEPSLAQIVEESPWLRLDMLESCFPYILLRASYHNAYANEEAALVPPT